jgi:NAD(P)-dependent dehydrogenase (short-subunit alcohol dehydrogenase family)
MRSVVITGASTGIGFACAKLLLDRGFRVFGSVRKQADAERLKTEFGANFTPLMFDVRGPDAAESQGPLHDRARSDAAIHGGDFAQAHARPDHRQAPRPDAAGVSKSIGQQ